MRARRSRAPRVLVIVGSAVTYLVVDVVVPILLSSQSERHVSPLGLIGLLPLVSGAVIVVAAGIGHVRGWRQVDGRIVKLDRQHLLTPEYLVTDGLYRFSRNPLYVGDIAMWLGWTILFGSVAVGIGAAVLTIGLSIGVRLEERGLARQFGARWYEYARATPRFIRLGDVMRARDYGS